MTDTTGRPTRTEPPVRRNRPAWLVLTVLAAVVLVIVLSMNWWSQQQEDNERERLVENYVECIELGDCD